MFKEEQSFLLEMKDLFFSEGFLKPSGIILYEADDFTLKVTAWGADEFPKQRLRASKPKFFGSSGCAEDHAAREGQSAKG